MMMRSCALCKRVETLDFKEIIAHIIGPSGGLFAFGIGVGGIFTFKYIAPRLYDAKIMAMEEKIDALEAEIAPYRRFKEEQALAAMKSKGEG